jgi:Ca2+-binding RTX toxin-like protein
MAFDTIQDYSSATSKVYAWGWYDDKDFILGGSAGDAITGGRGSDEVHGNGGDDIIADESYNLVAWVGPSLFFGWGESTLPENPTRLDFAHQDEGFYGSDRDGNFEFYGWGAALFHEGGDDRFFGDAGDDLVVGRSGNDFLDGGADNDQVYGGTGDDTVIGGSGDDDLGGNSGNDILLGGSGADILLGGTGADFLQGGLGADIIEGGDLAANAFALQVSQGIFTQAQANAMIAAANAGDTVNYDNSLGVDVDLERATQFGGEAQGDTITGVENIDGSRRATCTTRSRT